MEGALQYGEARAGGQELHQLLRAGHSDPACSLWKCQSQGGPKVTCLSGLLPLCNYDDFICGKNVISNEQRIINVYFPYGLGYVLIGSHS